MHDTVRLIIVLSLPQTILQVFKISFYDIRLDFQYDSEFKTGRFVCENTDVRWVIYLGLSLMVAAYMLCAFVAWCARDLPAAFNESTNVFKTAAVSAIVSVVALALQVYLDQPSTSPSASVSNDIQEYRAVSLGFAHRLQPQAIVAVAYIVLLPMVTLYYMVIPHMKRVLTSEKIVVSSLLKQMAPTVPGEGSVEEVETSSEKLRRREAAQSIIDQHYTASAVSTTPEFSQMPKSARIVMKRGEAIPPSVENELYRLEKVIGSIKHNM